MISDSGGNSAIDTEQGYEYTAGSVVAIMPRGGMSSEATHCQGFDTVGHAAQMSLSKGEYLVVGIQSTEVTIRMPVSLSAYVIVLGDNSPSLGTEERTDENFDGNGVAWN